MVRRGTYGVDEVGIEFFHVLTRVQSVGIHRRRSTMRGSLVAKGVEQLPPVEVRLRRTMDEDIEGTAGSFSHLRCSILSKLHS